MWEVRELQAIIEQSGLVDCCRCSLAANGTLTLELTHGDHTVVVAGVPRKKSDTFSEHLLQEIRTALAVANQ